MLRGPTVPIQKFLGEYSRIDIALDAVPYNGGTTTCDALWMGVPVVSLCGRHFQERMGASILRTLGRPEWVAEDEQDYTEATSYLAADLPRLGQVRKSLRAEMSASALCDGNNFTDGLEHNYQMMLKQTFL
jgi:predicted O-linked N-acetylglucosamine transferase (SPINDLY family)